MDNNPSHLKYNKTHEWVDPKNTDAITVGITDHAQALLGDIVFVELPKIGTELSQGDEAGVVESVKAASDIYAPISGTITAVNEALITTPELINQDAYGEGWIYKISVADQHQLEALMSACDYSQQIED